MALAQLVTIASRFARNVLLARLLVPADFGVGATFAITLSFWEMTAELGLHRQLVQATEGGSPAWQSNAQMLFVIRGIILTTLLYLLAPTIASYFEVAGATTSFRLLALVPLIRGFIHFDVFRYQRELQLGRLAYFQSIPTILGVLSAPLYAMFFKDYRAFLGVILTESVLASILSHLLARRAYHWGFEYSIFRRFLSFGLPLIGNGLLLFSVMHGDRFLIASYFDLDHLGAFSVVFMLSLTPTQALVKIHNSMALPLFSRSRERPAQLHSYCSLSAQVMCLFAGLLATLFITAGPWLVTTIYGDRYLLAVEAIPWIGLMCAIWLTRSTVSTTAIAHGETKIPLYSNFARAASFLVAWGLASEGFGLATIPICGFVGEIFAFTISVFLVSKRCKIPAQLFYGPLSMVAVFVASVWVMTRFNLPLPGIAPPVVAVLCLAALITYCAFLWPSLRNKAWGILRTN